MALTERNRAAVHQGLSRIIDEEAVAELLSNIPARDIDEPSTREHLQTEVALVRVDIAHVDAKLTSQVSGLDTRLTAQIAELDTRLTRQIAELDTRLTGAISELDTRLTGRISELDTRLTGQLATLDGRITQEAHRNLTWTVGSMVALLALLFTLLMAFG
ncbi:hypothetical protein BH24ACT4_BH24ACT4_24990 [soil metagenome]